MNDLSRQIRHATRAVRRRASLAVSRFFPLRVHEDSKLQTLQIRCLDGETQEGVERYQEYGFSSVPKLSDSLDGAVVFVGGNRSHGVIVGLEDRLLRPRSQPEGDVLLYTEQDDPTQGPTTAVHRLQLTRDKAIVLRGKSLDVTMTDSITFTVGTSTIHITQSQITIDSDAVLIQGKPDYKVHVHKNTQSGSGNSGPVYP